ncbi:hypothetical protein MKEN_00177500 [Mycena kentingensis (nom. inval.)]|nr:hypothetical protein MKEN_00177500 [Mycena kentingensis (nom. inval.)]
MAEYAYAFKAPPHPHPYYQPAPTQWDVSASRPFLATAAPQPYRQGHTHSTSQSLQAPPPPPASSSAPPPPPQQPPQAAPASLLWTELEPWMDQEYARQVCSLLGWDAHVRVPAATAPLDGIPGPATTANNAGYAVLTFTTTAAAAAALAQINAPISGTGSTMTMPNSSRSFVMSWAPAAFAMPAQTTNSPSNPAPTRQVPPSVSSSSYTSATTPYAAGYQYHQQGGVVSPTSPLSPVSAASGQSQSISGYAAAGYGASGYGAVSAYSSTPAPPTEASGASSIAGGPPYPKEYSVFVGDLAPETSNSDLVAVFRNPVLGLRNDRAPKFIRPFTSCKSAKIMLDPVTGVSRGYGFVRFTDESDQQRALIEMHGLYCLSRPMRISPATAKFKPPTESTSLGNVAGINEPSSSMPSSVSAPIASTTYYPQAASNSSAGAASGQDYFPQGHAPSPSSAQQPAASIDPSAEWKHHAQARAILGNLIGPNGEQLTSTDPYNTTVFVGGLSPLVGEDTLKSFFVPFGEIHYVKVPVGKHCGFVQFVRKSDAERAIEKMQGFPVGGSRIRLSWGRSQYKAAQAAAQAAQSAALQVAPAPAPPAQSTPPPQGPATGAGITPQMLAGMTQEQIVALIQKFGVEGLFSSAAASTVTTGATPSSSDSVSAAPSNAYACNPSFATQPATNTNPDPYRAFNSSPSGNAQSQPQYTEEAMKLRRDDGPFGFGSRSTYDAAAPPLAPQNIQPPSSFSPFSPDPNQLAHPSQQQPASGGLYPTQELLATRRDSYSAGLPHPSRAYAPGFFSSNPLPIGGGTAKSSGGGSSPTRGFASGSPPAFQANRYQDLTTRHPISRPNSGSAAIRATAAHDDWDPLQDLNGTLASLELDREREISLMTERGWNLKSPINENASEGSASSGGSVQFRMTPSPH